MRIQSSLRLGMGLFSLLALHACSDGKDPPAIENRITLSSFATCGELERWLQDSAVQEMRVNFESMKRGEGGFWGFGRGGVVEDAGAPSLGGAADKNAGPSAYTTTNTQVKGVDEADFMKNDGTRIFVLSGRKLFTAKSWPVADLAHAGELLIEGWPNAMFLDDKDRVVVMSNVWLPEFRAQNSQGGGVAAPCAECWWSGNATKLTVVDVSALAKPVVKHEYYLPGWFVNARRVGASVRVVQSDWFRWPEGVKWYPDYEPGLYENKNLLAQRLDQLADDNERLIRATPIARWLPDGKRRAEDGSLVDLGYQCGDFYAGNAPTHLGLVTVATLNLDKPMDPPSRTSVIAEPGEIFASPDNLYVASSHWWWWPAPGQVDHTYVHKFDITNPDKARYVASGGFDGHIVDQFSMDEWNGWFRVASTISKRVPDLLNPQNRWGTIETTNRVFVLGEKSGALDVVGSTEEMAKGERIQSARFAGDRGYIVTFRQVDPLFTLDLASPTNPRRVGELKVPGFSSYIHPIDRDHLLTIGTYVPDPNGGQVNWRERRMQLSIFDVTDFANPKQTANETVGTAYGWSEAAWEHKAFNYFPERGLLAIPFSDYSPQAGPNYWDSFTSDLRVFRIDAQKGITGLGAITMKDVFRQRDRYGWSYWWSPWIRRSVMASDEAKNEFVYAVSDAGIRVANAQSLGTPIATALFPDNMPPKP